LKSLVASLNLSDDQKQRLQGFMTEASEKVQEYKQQNPNASREDLLKKVAENRTAIGQRLVNFLTPDQLTKWDAEISKAKEFLGQKLAA
jgi:protein CpxP